MSKFAEGLKAREEKKVKNTTRRDRLASYFFDVSKLSLGGVVFSSAFGWFNDRSNYEYAFVAGAGVVMVILFAIIANKLLK